MAESPECANYGGVTNAALATYNRGDSDDVVWIGGVTHAKKETERNDRKQGDHLFLAVAAFEERTGNFKCFYSGTHSHYIFAGCSSVKFYNIGEIEIHDLTNIRADGGEQILQ